MADRIRPEIKPDYIVGNEQPQEKPSEKIQQEIKACLLEIQIKKDERQGLEAIIRSLGKRVSILKDNLITLLNKDN